MRLGIGGLLLGLASAATMSFAAGGAGGASAPNSRTLAVRGFEVFQARCAHCHGERADGDSRVSRVLQPPPSNLRASSLARHDLQRMIELGGAAAFSRSATMPAWRGVLPPEDIEAVVEYVHDLRQEEAH